MVIITLQRDKCIGCNYCAELSPNHFKMSKKDGKTVLLKSINKKGFHTLKIQENIIFDNIESSAKACPVKIINVKII